ncbi:MAG: adenosylcobinamide-phosphate synthase CbiB [Proteobacteria bacterium]|nr:adenosylcobinamide-phosphate synthase CbiB [Pseudomonadota bacterium]
MFPDVIGWPWTMAGSMLLAAWLLDLGLGDPRGWPHPVRLMGLMVTGLERAARRLTSSPAGLIAAGGAMVALVAGGALALAAALMYIAGLINAWAAVVLGVVLAWFCLATRDLVGHARPVRAALARGDLDEARARLAEIVGRDTGALDEAGVRRAMIETVAENLSDGVVGPLCYLALGGPALGVLYKAVSTMDSMIGYRSEQYEHLGKAAARADDVLNFIPARLTALLIVAAAPLLGLSGPGAWRALVRDHAKSPSPNAGWPEAAMAGALGVALGGPAMYFGRRVDRPALGPGLRSIDDRAVKDAIKMLFMVSFLAALLGGAALAVIHGW